MVMERPQHSNQKGQWAGGGGWGERKCMILRNKMLLSMYRSLPSKVTATLTMDTHGCILIYTFINAEEHTL